MRERAFAAALALLAMSATYFVLTAARGHPLWYLPLEGRWTFELPRGAVGMDWYWRAALSLAAAAIAYPLGVLLAIRHARLARPSTIKLLFGLSFGLMFWAVLYTSLVLATTPRQRVRIGPPPECVPFVR